MAEEKFRLMTSSMRCEQRRQRKKELARAAAASDGIFLAPPDRGTSGNIVGICVVVDFSDDEATVTQQQVGDFCNLQGYSEFGNNGSVRDYFDDNSMGKLQYTNVVTTYYRAVHPKTYYTNPNINYGTRARQLIKEALDHLANQGFAFDQLTADSGGYVYAMNIFYAGFNQNNWSEGLWPHAWNLATPYNIGSGRKLFDYQFTDMKSTLALGTFCHENGHMVCDFPDLYDKTGFKSRGAGKYCAMSGGGHGPNPGHISAYLKYKAGWSSRLTLITHGDEISLSSEQNDFAIFKKSETEYFILENRNKTGRDAALPSAGLTIWHVDELGDNSNEQRTPDLHFELSLEQADNKFELERGVNSGNTGDLYHGAGADEFSDDTGPDSKWWDGTRSELKVHDIGSVGTTITFKTSLHEDTNDSGVYKASSQPNLSIPDKNAVGIADTINFDDDVSISSIKVTVDITHSYRGDLRVTLHTPWATSLVLHQRYQGGSADDIKVTYDMLTAPVLTSLLGQSMKGEWSLQVQDLAAQDVGVLNSWELEAEGAQRKEVELAESPGTKIPDDDPAGIERTLTTDPNDTGIVGAVEVTVDITHTYIRDLVVSLRSPKGTLVHLHQRTGGSADDVVKTYTEALTPGLSAFHVCPSLVLKVCC